MRRGVRFAFVGVCWGVTACGEPTNPGAGSETSSAGSTTSSTTSPTSTTSTTSTGSDSTGSTGSSTGADSTGTAETSDTPTTSTSTSTSGSTSGSTSEPGSSSSDSTGSIDACSFVDPDAKLCWQEPPAPDLFTWKDASTYCDGLNLRLPTVQELASLVRGCPSAMCPVEDPGCLALDCRAAPECQGCAQLGGPGPGGCYWDPALTGPCDWYWTSSGVDGGPFDAWFIYFQAGSVDYGAQGIPKQVRCVRSEL